VELDPPLFRAALAQSQANLLNAQANLTLAKAKQARARDLLAKNSFRRRPWMRRPSL